MATLASILRSTSSAKAAAAAQTEAANQAGDQGGRRDSARRSALFAPAAEQVLKEKGTEGESGERERPATDDPVPLRRMEGLLAR